MRKLALGCVLAAFAFSAAYLYAASTPPPGFQLPDDVAPLKYDVTLSIDPNRDTFEGTVSIALDIRKPTSVIWLNAKDIEPENAEVGSEHAHARVAGKELIAIDLPHEISGSSYSVQLTYRARLDDKGVLGAYRRKVDADWYVYTTFTPIEARRAIPCFDDPRFKTPWRISIEVPQGQIAFSNAPETGESTAPDGQHGRSSSLRRNLYRRSWSPSPSGPSTSTKANLLGTTLPFASSLPRVMRPTEDLARKPASPSCRAWKNTPESPIPSASWITSRWPTGPLARWRIPG